MEQVVGLRSGGESRQIVVQNDKIALSDIAPEGWGEGGSLYEDSNVTDRIDRFVSL